MVRPWMPGRRCGLMAGLCAGLASEWDRQRAGRNLLGCPLRCRHEETSYLCSRRRSRFSSSRLSAAIYPLARAQRGYGHVSAVAAFDSGNLLAVATALHERWPGKQIMIAGDDDHRLENNPGRAKAVEAAAAVKGLAVFPQLDAQQRERGLTDFNDLALENRPLAGQQLEEAVSRARTRQIENELERVREQSMEVGTQV